MIKKKILIAGYYGFENIGDEAILSSILSNLRAQRSNLEFIVISGDPKQTSQQYHVRSILWTDIPSIMDACQECDLILLGGGGLFHDYWGTTEEHVLTQSHSGISFYSDFPIFAKLYNKPCILFALGVGPLLTQAGKNLTKISFENANLATVRDIESLKLLQEVGVDTSHIKVTADSVFNLSSDFDNARTILKKININASPVLAISLRQWNVDADSNRWQKEIAAALDQFAEKHNILFLFIPFQISPDNPLTDDLAASKEVIELMKHPENTFVFEEKITAETLSGMIGQCDFVLGMRLHSLIFSVKEAIPFVGLIYDPKVQNLINVTGMQEFSMKMEEISSEKLFNTLNKAWIGKEQTKKLLSQNSDRLKELADENTRIVMEQLDLPALSSSKQMDAEYLRKLLLKQTRKLAETEKTAHTLWLQTQGPKQENIKQLLPVQITKTLDFEPSPAQLKSYRPDIICFSIIDWEFRYQRPQQMMSQFASQGHRVFYISTSRFQSIDESVRVRFIKENVFEIQLSAHHIPELYGENVSGENLEAMIKSLEQLTAKFQIKEAIGYVMIASWQKVSFKAKNRFGWKIVYDCMDEWDNFPLVQTPIIEAELRLARDCDLLVVTSQILFDKWSVENRPMLLARNAADYEFYEQYYLPNNLLDNVKHPIVGYYGAIADWFDLELMIYIAKNRPEYTFILIGGIFDVDVSELSALPNVMLLGQQPYETMPQYLYHFDICIIPFKINPITEATDPVKIYEYMCGGKPIVSVALPEIMHYQELLYIAENKEDFVFKLDQALAEDNVELQSRRKVFSQNNSWGKRVLAIDDALQSLSATQIELANPLPLIFPKESMFSSQLLGKHEGLEYWSVIYKLDNFIYKQCSSDLAKREFDFLSKLKSEYFPIPLEYKVETSFSVMKHPKIEGDTLEAAVSSLNLSVTHFYNFVVHCLNLLAELKTIQIVHRDIRRDNLKIKNGKPIVLDSTWVGSEVEDVFYPFGLGGSERPTTGSFSDVYSIGKILAHINQRRYPAFTAVISLMTEPNIEMRIDDIELLKLLFYVAHLEEGAGNMHSSEHATEINLIRQIFTRTQKLEAYRRLENSLNERISALKQELSNLNRQRDVDSKQIQGLMSAISQKEQTLQSIRNSSSWKTALRLQKISKILLFRK